MFKKRKAQRKRNEYLCAFEQNLIKKAVTSKSEVISERALS
jgi:hypothetical protein